jgi:hypothetical protein
MKLQNPLVAAAVMGMFAGAAGCDKNAAPGAQPAAKAGGDTAQAASPMGAKHACKGQNECKGQGGCKVEGKNACMGHNQCKGQGGCKGV